MSFILDALKKSEAERQRQAGPTLLELRITPPRRRYPLWALVVGVLLAVNIAVLLIFLLNRPPPATAPSSASTPSAPAAAVAATPARNAITPGTQPLAPGAGASAVAKVPPLVTPDSASSAASPPVAPPGPVPAPAALAATADDGAGAAGSVRNPADYEPALPRGNQPRASAPASPVGAVDYSNLPSISQISGNVPAMQLDLLDYSEIVSERYALIDMHRVREGDVLPDGARVLAITPNGVAMDYRGQDFLLRPGGTAQ